MDGIGQRLREERQLRGWSQRDLARETGVNPDTISGIETEQHEPRPSTLRKLAEGLGLEVRDFFAEPALPKAEAPRDAGQLDHDLAAMLVQALENARKVAQPLIEQDDQTIEASRQALKRMKGGIGVSDAYFVEESPELAEVSSEQTEELAKVVDLELEREQRRRRKMARSG